MILVTDKNNLIDRGSIFGEEILISEKNLYNYTIRVITLYLVYSILKIQSEHAILLSLKKEALISKFPSAVY